MMKILFYIMLLTPILFSFNACESTGSPQSDTGRLIEFSYEFGGYTGGYWNYRVFEHEGNIYFEGLGSNGVMLNVKGEAPENSLHEIMEIIETYSIRRWNGFHESDIDIDDGYSFKISAVYENDTLNAYGHMLFPEGYDEGHQALAGYLDNLASIVPTTVRTHVPA